MRSCLSREIPLMPSFSETSIYRGSFPGAALRSPAKASLSLQELHCPCHFPLAATGRSSSQNGHYHPAPLVQACSGTPHSKPFVRPVFWRGPPRVRSPALVLFHYQPLLQAVPLPQCAGVGHFRGKGPSASSPFPSPPSLHLCLLLPTLTSLAGFGDCSPVLGC